MTETACRSADWNALGYRDGAVFGMRPRIDQYAWECKAHNVAANEPAYLEGWEHGYREWVSRVHANDCCGPP